MRCSSVVAVVLVLVDGRFRSRCRPGGHPGVTSHGTTAHGDCRLGDRGSSRCIRQRWPGAH
jgi:hypothetical protein